MKIKTVVSMNSFQNSISKPRLLLYVLWHKPICSLSLSSPGLPFENIVEIIPTTKLDASVMYTFGIFGTPNAIGKEEKDHMEFIIQVTTKVHIAAVVDLFQNKPNIISQKTGVIQANSQFMAATTGGR